MALDLSREVTITIDSLRSVTVTPTDNATVVLALEDPRSVAIVELVPNDVDKVIDALKGAKS